MRKVFVILSVVLAVALAFGCSGKTTAFHMKDGNAKENVIVFPDGTVFGGASAEQAAALAKTLVDSHNMSILEIAEIKGLNKEIYGNHKEYLKNHELIRSSTQKLEKSLQQLTEAVSKNPETMEKMLQMVEQLSKRQGTGEITLFFPNGSSRVHRRSIEYKRLIDFVDYLVRENRGRKLLLVSIGSSSATGDKKFNYRLAKNRAEFPIDVIDKYLVNTPHEFFKVYGTGDIYSPENVKPKEHQRYQYARLIAIYETNQTLELPVEPAEDTF
ncbi:MAG TPA: hypothetical protein VF790_06740 [Dissulfurispiraceae bacterium]